MFLLSGRVSNPTLHMLPWGSARYHTVQSIGIRGLLFTFSVDQVSTFRSDTRSPRTSQPTAPASIEPFAMPTVDRGWLDQHQRVLATAITPGARSATAGGQMGGIVGSTARVHATGGAGPGIRVAG